MDDTFFNQLSSDRRGAPNGGDQLLRRLSQLFQLLLLFLAVLPAQAEAQAREIAILELRPDTGVVDLQDHLLFSAESAPFDVFLTYADPTGFVPLDSIDFAGNQPLIGCFYVDNKTEAPLSFILVFGDQHYQAEVIQFREDATRRIQKTGLFLPFSAMDHSWGRQGAVELLFPPGNLTPVFFQVRQDYPGAWRDLPVALYPTPTWNDRAANRLTFKSVLLGLLIALLLGVLYLGVKTRQGRWFYFGATILLTAGHVLAANNLLPGLIFPEAPHWRRVLFLALIPAWGSCCLLWLEQRGGGRQQLFSAYAIMSALVFLLGAFLTIISPEATYPLMRWHLMATAVVLLGVTWWMTFRARPPAGRPLFPGALLFALGIAGYYWDAYRHLPAFDGAAWLQGCLLFALLCLALGRRRSPVPVASASGRDRAIEPVAEPGSAASPTPAPARNREALRAQPKLLLVVAEDEVFRRHVRDDLSEGFHSLEASDGREGLHLAIHQIPDLIVIDDAMNEMEGADLYRALRADPRTSHVPVILHGTGEPEKLEGLDRTALQSLPGSAGPSVVRDAVAQLLQVQKIQHQRFQRGENPAFSALDHFFLTDLQELTYSGPDRKPAATSEALSRALGMSPAQLHRKIRGLTGLSLQRFLEHSEQV